MASNPYRKKLRKSNRANPTQIEDEVSRALVELEANNPVFKAAFAKDRDPVCINTVKEIDVDGKNALILFYPLRFLRRFHKVQKPLVTELEKKFPGRHVLLVAQRKISAKAKSNKQMIQRSRTMHAVHNDILDDLVFPAEVVGRRIRVKLDGSKQWRVFLDAHQRDRVEGKLDTFAAVYKELTGKDTTFGFMTNPALQQFA